LVKAFSFSKRRIEALEPPRKGRAQYRDSKTPGLVLRVTPNGTRTFAVYKKLNGRPIRYRLGVFPEMTVEQARRRAAEVLGEIALGRNPAEARRYARQEPTLSDLFAHWVDHARQHKKTWAADEEQYNRYLKPWARRRLSSIKKADVQALHARLGRRNGRYAANRAVALLRAVFNKAADLGWNGPNPCTGVRMFRERARDRFLKPDELPRFFRALEEEPNPILRGFFLICLFTGARRRNVEAMRWDDLDFANALWRIPATKRGEPQVVPLSPVAMQVLIGLRPLAKDGWVFPALRKSRTGHLTDPMPAWRRILQRAGLVDLRIHDLRRSLGSWEALTGASLQVIGASLGHTRAETTQIYSRLTLERVRESVNQATTAMLAAGGLLEGPRQEELADG